MDKMKMHSPNMTQENITRIREMFPDCVTEAKDESGNVKLAVDFDQLRQELSDSIVEGPQERYHLNWPGKREALLTANAPIAKTFRPCPEESVDFDTTKNLFIEGDNLEALKLLQETYLGKVKMIYIDPPYNTGNDFIYEDDFAESSGEFLLRSNQKDENGNRLIANTEANGRFHSDWLSMLYPRLKLARNLLQDNGVVFISIDNGEFANLRKLCDEVFGEENLIGVFKWNRVAKAPSLSSSIRSKYEYVVAYTKLVRFKLFGKPSYNTQGPLWHLPNKRVELLFPSKSIKVKQSFDKGHYGGTYDVEFINELIEEDGLNKNPLTVKAHSAWSQTKIDDYVRNGSTFEIKKSPTTFYVTLSSEGNFIAPSDLITKEECGVGTNTEASDALKALKIPFDYPKPVSLVSYLITMVTHEDPSGTVLDFFSGSATSAHAVMNLNAEDGGNRNFIMVQLPEACDEKSDAFKADLKTIANIGKERIRRVGKMLLEGESHEGWNKDVGFRVLKVDSSNMADVYYTPDAIAQGDLLTRIDNIKHDRTSEDLLFQVLLDWGVDLSLPIRKETIQGKLVFFVDENALVACFDRGVSEDLVKELAKHEPLRVVFRDNGFVSDAVKINVEQIFKQMSPGTEVKSI